MKSSENKTLVLVEASVMIALATVMSLVKFVDMPYGGSVTLASMLPIAVISYRHGILAGLGSGAIYAILQQLLGLGTLSYATSWQAVIAIILLDYILAFVVVGLGGMFRRVFDTHTPRAQASALALGMLCVCIMRYTLHVIAGATVWAGLSIPSEAALIYSLGYNATYMIPETIVNVAVIAYIGNIIDFRREKPMPFRRADSDRAVSPAYRYVGVGALVIGAIVTLCEIFAHLQDAESGEFTFAFLGEVDWVLVLIVLGLSVAVFVITELVRHRELRAKAE